MKTEKQLKARCELWQKRLRLQDWIISDIIRVRAHEQSSHGSLGEVHYSLEEKRARITLLHPVDMHPAVFDDREEQTLVHELLELHLAPLAIEANSPEETLKEQAINCIADALVEAYGENS